MGKKKGKSNYPPSRSRGELLEELEEFVDEINNDFNIDSTDAGVTVVEEGKVDKKKKKKQQQNNPSRSEKLRKAKLDDDDIEFSGASSNIGSYNDFNLDVIEGVANEEKLENESVNDVTNERQSEARQTWPSDCYSFIALHGPLDNPRFFLFGILVWAMQVRRDACCVVCARRPRLIV